MLAITARIAGSVYFQGGLDRSIAANILFLTFSITGLALWAVYIIKMKKHVAIRCGDQVVRLNSSRFVLDVFKDKNIQNAFGIDTTKAIPVSRKIFSLIKQACRIREFDIRKAQLIQRKEKQTSLRYLKFQNQFFLIPDSETQIALLGFNGNSPAPRVDDKIVDLNTENELLSVKQWKAHPIKENRIDKLIRKPINRIEEKKTTPKKTKPKNRMASVKKTAKPKKTKAASKAKPKKKTTAKAKGKKAPAKSKPKRAISKR